MERPCANMSDPCEWLCYYEFPISLPFGEPLMNVRIRFERFCSLWQVLRERIAAVTVDPLRNETELRLFSAFFMQHSMMDPPRTFVQCAFSVVGASWLHRQYRVELSPHLLAAIRSSRATGHHVFVQGVNDINTTVLRACLPGLHQTVPTSTARWRFSRRSNRANF